MSNSWEDEGKGKILSIPGMALPGLRDLRVQFVALIEFDMFMGPVVHINELQKGSSYIKKLRNYQTVSEVYAGVARADVDILHTPEDVIAVFRYYHEMDADDTDITTVFLISCIPDSDMEPIKIIGSRALTRSKGDPNKIGQELSLSLRDYQSSAKLFERLDSDQKIKILADGQITKSLEHSFIKGFSMIDLESNIADFRYFPRYLEGIDLDPPHILTYLDKQYDNINPGMITSLLYNNLPFIITRVGANDTFFLTVVENADLVQIKQMGDWLLLAGKRIEEEWRFANKKEIQAMLTLLNKAFEMKSPPDFLENYIHTSLIVNKLKPLLVNLKYNSIQRPVYVKEDLWNILPKLEGKKSILELSENHDLDTFDLIRFLEWGKYRHIIEYLKN